MLDDPTAKGILHAYTEAHRDEEGQPAPLMILHGIREEVTIRPHIELPSAYHMAHYVDEFVTENVSAVTVCGRFYKQIGKKLFQGTILYHVDRIGSHLIRGFDLDTGRYHVLDDSPYWNKFPYDFDEGPMDPEMPIGYHPGPVGGEADEEGGDGDDESEA